MFTLNIIYIARLNFIEPPSSGSLQNVSHGKLCFVFVQVVLLRGGRGGDGPGLPLVLEAYRLDGDHPHHARPGAVRRRRGRGRGGRGWGRGLRNIAPLAAVAAVALERPEHVAH